VLKGDGRDIKGNGNASALITATLEELSPTSAKCVVHTDLNMTGKVAQFGRGALADISGKLMAQFATNLDEMLAKDAASTPEPAAEAASTEAEPETVAAAADAPTEAAADAPAAEAAADPSKPTTRIINGPAAEPIDAFSLGGTALLKRLLPVFGGVVILLLALSRARKK